MAIYSYVNESLFKKKKKKRSKWWYTDPNYHYSQQEKDLNLKTKDVICNDVKQLVENFNSGDELQKEVRRELKSCGWFKKHDDIPKLIFEVEERSKLQELYIDIFDEKTKSDRDMPDYVLWNIVENMGDKVYMDLKKNQQLRKLFYFESCCGGDSENEYDYKFIFIIYPIRWCDYPHER